MNDVPGQSSTSRMASGNSTGGAEIEPHSQFAHKPNSRDEWFLPVKRHSAGGVPRDLPHALDERVFLEAGNVRLERVLAGASANYGRHGRRAAAPADVQDIFRLGHLAVGVHVDFHVHGPHDAHPRGGCGIVLHHEVAGQRLAGLQPGEPQLAQVPKVLVGVDDREVGFPAGRGRIGLLRPENLRR